MKKNYLIIPNNVFESISALGLSKNERRAVDLIIRLTYGIQSSQKILNESCYLIPRDFTLTGIYEPQVKGVLRKLEVKEVIIWDKENSLFRFNDKLTETISYQEERFSKVKSTNLRKVNGKSYGNNKGKINKSITQQPEKIPVQKENIVLKDSKNILNTTEREVLLRCIKEQQQIQDSERYLSWLIRTYSESFVLKLLKRNVEFSQWSQHLDYWVQQQKGDGNVQE